MREDLAQFAGVIATFDADDTLGRGRQHLFGSEYLADAIIEPEALEARSGKNDGLVIAIVELGKPCVDVAAQRFDTKVRT